MVETRNKVFRLTSLTYEALMIKLEDSSSIVIFGLNLAVNLEYAKAVNITGIDIFSTKLVILLDALNQWATVLSAYRKARNDLFEQSIV